MSLHYAVDRLYEMGWSSLGGMAQGGVSRLEDGRLFPTVATIHKEFAESGLSLMIRHVSLFNCYRAEWQSAGGEAQIQGYCVGTTEEEAAVYALAQLIESDIRAGV